MMIIAQRILFCLLLMFIGFCAGMCVGSFLVRSAMGFTGSPAALGYGLAGLVTGLLAGVLLSRIMQHAMFRNALLIAFILSLLIAALIIYRVKRINQQQTRVEKVKSA